MLHSAWDSGLNAHLWGTYWMLVRCVLARVCVYACVMPWMSRVSSLVVWYFLPLSLLPSFCFGPSASPMWSSRARTHSLGPALHHSWHLSLLPWYWWILVTLHTKTVPERMYWRWKVPEKCCCLVHLVEAGRQKALTGTPRRKGTVQIEHGCN